MDTQVKTAIDAALELLKNAAGHGQKKDDVPVAPTVVETIPPLHRSDQFHAASIPSTTTPEQVGTLKQYLVWVFGLKCLQS